MYFDLEKLKQARTIDPFSLPPVEISESLAFTAGIILDNSMENPKVRAFDGVAVSRVFAHSPTPRMRLLFAVLG